MKYDFTTIVDRSKMSSGKWDGMKKACPELPEGIIPFSVADMELKNAPEIIDGLKDFLDDVILGYTSPSKGYLDSVCSWMKTRHNWEINEEWIVTSPGVVPAFFNAVKAYTEPGEGVIIMTPVYYPFEMAMQLNGRNVVKNQLINNNGHYEIDFADFEEKAKDSKNKVLLFCSPHNPVGRVWTKEELLKVADICLANDILIISDEIHFDLIMPGYEHTVFASLSEEIADHCIVCTAPSKTFNLAGMQASNIIIKNPDIRKKLSDELMTSAMFMLGILGYKSCELAYTKCSPWLDELLVLLDTNRKLVEDFMAANIPEIKVCPLEGTYLQWWDCRGLGLEYKELEEFMTKKAYMFFDEGHMFGSEGDGFERINLACPTAVLQEALERMAAALKAR